MKFLKNVFKIIICGVAIILVFAATFPNEGHLYALCIVLPSAILIGAYCMTHKVTFDALFENFMKW